jgi:hypothetical protein
MDSLPSYLRELVRTYLGYLAASAAFIPGGVLYALLQLNGWGSPGVAIGLLLPSLWLAHWTWAWAIGERARVEPSTAVRQITWASPSFAPTLAAAGVGVVVVVSLKFGPPTAGILSSHQGVTSAAVNTCVISA